jgi:predicted nucleotidyltransferase
MAQPKLVAIDDEEAALKSRRSSGRRVIERVVRRLEQRYRPSGVILFGSHARGRPTGDSDIDLFIIKATARPFHRRLSDVRRLVSPLLRGCPFDPIVMTPKEVKERVARGDQFIRTILTEGKLVYGRR